MQEFCQDCEGQRQLVTRNPLLQDNAALPAALQERIGDAVYRGLRTGFQVGALSPQTLTLFMHSLAHTAPW